MQRRTVLICGASIAGPALAFWLTRFGFRAVVVERAPALRTGGQNIDVRGAAREVARRMGIEAAMRAATTGEAGVRFVDAANVTKAEFPAGQADRGGLSAEVEILRGDLSRILYERTRDGVEYLFGDRVMALNEHEDRVTVTFERGAERDFDLVVAADGIRSRTRALIVGDEPEVRHVGLYTAYLTIPRAETDSAWARWFNAPGSRTITLRPDNEGTTRATLSFMSPPRGYERLGLEEQKAFLQQHFADAGWEAPRVLAALAGVKDLYFDAVGQVRAPRWSSGRGALLGDAAYCPSPISGMGTSLALVGAYVLAGELAKHPDHRDAFAAYERLLRPYVDEAQKLPPGAPGLANPKTRLGIALFNTGLKVASTLLPLFSRFGSPPSEKLELPDYE